MPAVMPELATALRSGVLASTQLCPIASFGNLPVWVRVSSTEVQSAATTSSCLSYCIKSLPVMASLQTLSAAFTAVGRTTAAPINAAAASTCRINRIIVSFCAGTACSSSNRGARSRDHPCNACVAPLGVPVSLGESIRNAEPLMHDRARRRVLQKLFLLRKQVVLDGERRQRGLVEAGQDQLLLARVGIDIANGEHARQAGLEFLGIHPQGLLLQLQPPLRNRAELRRQAEEDEHVIGIQRMGLAALQLDVHTLEHIALTDERMRQ